MPLNTWAESWGVSWGVSWGTTTRQTLTFSDDYLDWDFETFPTDYLDWDNTVQVTLRKLASSPGGSTLSDTVVQIAYRGIPSKSERLPTGGTYQGEEVIFRLPIDLLGSVVPYPADLIIDDQSVPHAVIWAHLVQLTQEYRCFTVDLSIYLPDLVTIERPSIYTQDDHGLDIPIYVSAYTNLNARVQEVDSETVVENDVATIAKYYDIVLPQQVTVESNDRVLWNGLYYNVMNYTKGQLITDLPVLRVRNTN